MRNSVIAQNRVVQMRYNKMLREMIFAQNCAKCFYFAQRFYATEAKFCVPFRKSFAIENPSERRFKLQLP